MSTLFFERHVDVQYQVPYVHGVESGENGVICTSYVGHLPGVQNHIMAYASNVVGQA